MFTDFFINGKAHGEFADHFMNGCHFDPGLLRPYLDNGRVCVTVNTGKKWYNPRTQRDEPVSEKYLVSELAHRHDVHIPTGITSNAMTLRKDEWQELDRTVLTATRRRQTAWTDLLNSNSFGGFDAMATLILEHETQSDPGEAIMDMDGLSADRGDTPLFQLEGLPLPVTHSGFSYSARRLASSRRMGVGLDSRQAEASGNKVGEKIETVTIGIDPAGDAFGYGDATDYGRAPKVWGYRNFPDTNPKINMTAPDGTNGEAVLTDWLNLRELLYDDNFYGPYIAYTGREYDQFLDNDFKTNSDKSLRQRLLEVQDFQAIRRLDFLPGNDVMLVEMSAQVARAINGMGVTTVRWTSSGDLQMNFKVMAIQVPQVRADFTGNCGIALGTTS